MIISIGVLLLAAGVIISICLLIYFIFLQRRQENDQIPEEQSRKGNQKATASLALGIFSAPPSLCWLSIIISTQTSGGGDFQGIAMLLPVFFWVMSPVGLLSVILGISGLIDISRNRTTESGTGRAIAGILLGLPGCVNLCLFLIFFFGK